MHDRDISGMNLCRLLRHAVTLTIDRLTLNDCNISTVMCSNSVPIYSAIEQSSAEL